MIGSDAFPEATRIEQRNGILRRVQFEHRRWRAECFPDKANTIGPHRQAFGIVEELGELIDALTPNLDTRIAFLGSECERPDGCSGPAIYDALADTVIYAAGYCNDVGLSLKCHVPETDSYARQESANLCWGETDPKTMLHLRAGIYFLRWYGQLSHHHLKREEGIRGSDGEHLTGISVALRKILAGVRTVASHCDFNILEAVQDTWYGNDKKGIKGVVRRDWKAGSG